MGGVLLEWNPRHLYRKLFDGDEAAMEHFLATVCTKEWNERQDAGRSFADGTRELLPRHADKLELIEAWGRRFGEMIPGAIDGVVDVLAELRQRGIPLYAITNFSAETFPPQLARFDFLSWFDGIVVSGVERVMKPDPRIFRILLDRYAVTPRVGGVHRRCRRERRRGDTARNPRHPLPLARPAAEELGRGRPAPKAT